MSGERQHRLVLDVGKTNVKIHVLNAHQESLAVHNRENVVLDTGPYPHADVDGIWDWMMSVFRDVAADYDVGAIAVTTHGATAALVDTQRGGNGLVLPVLDYEWRGVDPADRYAEVRPPFSETYSPDLPAGLNLGRQLYWQRSAFSDHFAKLEAILLYPQYWAWRLTRKMVSEVSSLGCHTDLWSPAERGYSSLVHQQRWTHLFPPLASAWDSIGTITAEISEKTGLSAHCRVHAGVHDSNASLLRFLLAMPDSDFCVVSSGTWVVCMSIGSSVAMLDETKDMLANVDVEGDMVPCVRFMGGREYAEICSRCNSETGGQAGEDEVASIIANDVVALPDFSGGSGPFGGRAPELRGQISNGNALASLYCALMVDYCLNLLQVEGHVIIVGSFVQNSLLCALVAQLRGDQSVHLSSDTAGAARGAAQLTDWSRPVSVFLNRCEPSRVEGLTEYADRWRQLAGG